MNIEGLKAEKLVINILKNKSITIRESSKYENINHHIDVFIRFPEDEKEYSYDIKTIKRINRGDNLDDNIIWLEFMNVIGQPGWLKSEKLDRILFIRNDGYYIFDRKQLLEWAKQNIENKSPIYTKEYKTPYRRLGRRDITTYVFYNDIKHLLLFKIN